MKKPTVTPCPPHHWLVGEPHYGLGRADALIETTDQVCKKCGISRKNLCVIVDEEHNEDDA